MVQQKQIYTYAILLLFAGLSIFSSVAIAARDWSGSIMPGDGECYVEIDGRVLFGGGRNLDFDTEQTTEIALNKVIQDDLDHKLANVILPGLEVKVAQRWAGIMAFGSTKQPIVKAISTRVYGVYRMGGMGVALGSSVASTLAGVIKQRQQ